ncbi:MAG: S8 family serine peptidase [Kiloniellales bacterium]
MITRLALAVLLLAASPVLAGSATSPEAWLRLAVERLCAQVPLFGLEAQQALPGAWLLGEDLHEAGQAIARVEQRFALPGGDELRVLRSQPGGRLRRFTVEIYEIEGEGQVPLVQAIADAGCQLHSGRRIVRKGNGRTVLEQLEGDLETLRWTETLEAPWPAGSDPGGPRVALVDSGLAYDLPLYRDRLARGPDGQPLGYDFWDLDPWPYDGDLSLSPFLPIRHGSAVASVLAREAPDAALIPFRYPRPDMSRMGALVERAAAAGARILAMPIGSRHLEDWTSFAEAMRDHPELLAVVSAGNDGRDLDRDPLWPAALGLPNVIVVTSADGFGRLAPDANWGAESVHIMLPAENVPVVDFRGASGTASGSSYAVPRLAALAARLLAAEPKLTAHQLKAAIFARAVPSPYEDRAVAVGWIPDPLYP